MTLLRGNLGGRLLPLAVETVMDERMIGINGPRIRAGTAPLGGDKGGFCFRFPLALCLGRRCLFGFGRALF